MKKLFFKVPRTEREDIVTIPQVVECFSKVIKELRGVFEKPVVEKCNADCLEELNSLIKEFNNKTFFNHVDY